MSVAPSGRVVGLIRVSQIGKRTDDKLHSPDVQDARIREACEHAGQTLIAIHRELDVSGAQPLRRRPGLTAAIKTIEAGQADQLVVAYFDRLVRSLKVQQEVVERVEAAG